MRYVGAAAVGLTLAASLVWHLHQAERIRDLEWDKAYWRGELMSTYERETLEPTYLDGQCCSSQGEGCNEPIYGSDC